MPPQLIPLAGILAIVILGLPMVIGSQLRRLREHVISTGGANPSAKNTDVARLEAELAQTREELRQLAERQHFVEQLLDKRSEPAALPK